GLGGGSMSDQVKAAAIIGAAIVVAAIAASTIISQNTPFNRCVAGEKARAEARGRDGASVEFDCAIATRPTSIDY
ncbi:MAG: hypothetical protein KJS97_16465, partial [Alphaproteobacteria bacterium]|nr:hypothetical protein [Alphaproteobacteria bacterium]